MPHPAEGDDIHESVLRGVRLLVVDDQRDERELLAEILRRHGAEVRMAGGASEALEILPKFAPDVLLSDIAMPGEDGHVLMRRVRQLEGRLGRTPALAVTAHARADDRNQAFAAGFQDYLAKPVDMRGLVRRVARLAGRVRPPDSRLPPE
jgi:CheY-like chemotaxis protein